MLTRAAPREKYYMCICVPIGGARWELHNCFKYCSSHAKVIFVFISSSRLLKYDTEAHTELVIIFFRKNIMFLLYRKLFCTRKPQSLQFLSNIWMMHTAYKHIMLISRISRWVMMNSSTWYYCPFMTLVIIFLRRIFFNCTEN